ncbi:MAG: glycoside hydrolase family 5 protein [Chitinophagaceae bacterium]|nr:glycoside hydrolase family 5 protein [Chitinophagaceae bacterium]
MRLFVILLFIGFSISKSPAQLAGKPFGINICGAEFEEKIIPGILNKDYAYPSESDIEYFYQQGFQLMTIPFKWERLQNSPGGELDRDNLNEIRRILDYCAPRNIKVILSMHNFGRYRIDTTEYIVGCPRVTRKQFSEFWVKMANEFIDIKNIYGFQIMCEPHDMGIYDWFTTAQEAIRAIREVDKKNIILISGDNYANAEKWRQYSDVLKNLVDPFDNLVYDAHCYFDKNYSGRYKESYDSSGSDEYTGVVRIMPFVRWLKDHNKRGFIGEYGVPDNDLRWFKLMDNFLKYLSENNINGCYWAAGSRWNKYPLSVQPFVQAERPQMEVLLQYKWTQPNLNSSFNFLLPETYLFLPNLTLVPISKGGVFAPASIEKKIKPPKNK